MRLIETWIHGYLDYIVGLLMIAAPWLFDFAAGGTETWIFVLLGAGAIIYSLFTDYERGVWRQINMRTHLTLDLLSGALLAASPWLFGFADYVWAPHLIFGILEIVISLLTKRVPGTEKGEHHHKAPSVR